VIIADTVKGKGVKFMEHTALDSDVELYKFHSGAPSESAYSQAATELIAQANRLLAAARAKPLQLETVTRPAAPAALPAQRLVEAYTRALVEQARRDRRIVALDADLVLDTGLIPFKNEFPDRFVECGIAEQDMVSQAGGMALCGLLPVVHSFACFLSARPNEQVYNNATERSKIVYVGALAGVVPGGPGHSHQAVRDVAALGAIPGLVAMEPSCEAEVGLLLDWALQAHPGSTYLRLTSLPWPIPFALPAGYRPQLGCGVTLREGADVAIVGYGPVLLSAAHEAAAKLEGQGIRAKVINLPWLNVVNAEWLDEALADIRDVVALDNHYVIGGQGDRIAQALLERDGATRRFHHVGLVDVPVCGTHDEVLKAHGLDADALTRRIRECIGARRAA
jgi:transketolase